MSQAQVSTQVQYGFGGWLAFYVYAGLTVGPVLALAMTAGAINQAESRMPDLADSDEWKQYVAFCWAQTLLLCAWQVLVSLRLRNERVPGSVEAVKVLFVWGFVTALGLEAVAMIALLPDYVSGYVFGSKMLAAALGAVISGGIWYAYFSQSERVAQVYGLNSGAAAEAVQSAPVEAAPDQSVAVVPPPSQPAPVVPTVAAPPPVPTTQAAGIQARLTTLKDLLDQGLISQDEYAAKRQGIIDAL